VTNGFVILLIVSWAVDRAAHIVFRSTIQEKVNSDS
jgi:hypothetical protein